METILAVLLTFLGGFLFPMFTLGCVLIHYNHPILGTIFIVVSIIIGLIKLASND